MDIEEIRDGLRSGQLRLRVHADERVNRRHITRDEIREAILRDEIIEEYPIHHYGPCCLIYGTAISGRPLHVLVALPPDPWVITVYEPDPARWVDFRIRRRNR